MTAVTSDPGPQACGRFEWERIVRRLELPMRVKFTAMMVASYADADGSRVRPGAEVLAAVTAQGASTIRKQLAALQEYGLLVLVSRGGGRSGRGRAAEFRLTVPVDLLERVPMLPVGERRLSAVPDSPLAQGSAQSGSDTVSPLATESGQSGTSTVDNPADLVDSGDSALAQKSGQSEATAPIDRSENTVTERLSARFERLTARSSERLPEQLHQPPKTTTTTRHPTQPPTARASPPNDACPICRHPHAFLDPCRPARGAP
ncbi:hypothetical protein VA596_41490 [Amycolatopsis sp., V23-08]|uniref:Helix-turn-helix domain-containing protein n=1 Tax=Amycolatopsis heterodermiae TaxID=3110235 RepID=A0ABU5RIE9_9PSEU|nr:hypothetical protein [Amycolatopsis sp., V23-08]MEA5366060.1 hypothetical protein [Amycolatopsis sp., V23-08]